MNSRWQQHPRGNGEHRNLHTNTNTNPTRGYVDHHRKAPEPQPSNPAAGILIGGGLNWLTLAISILGVAALLALTLAPIWW